MNPIPKYNFCFGANTTAQGRINMEDMVERLLNWECISPDMAAKNMPALKWLHLNAGLDMCEYIGGKLLMHKTGMLVECGTKNQFQ